MKLQPFLKLFKTTTANLIESKHSQVKRGGAHWKQREGTCGHVLFVLSAYIAEKKWLPPSTITGRSLWKYLMGSCDKKVYGYEEHSRAKLTIQTVLPAFLRK